jgi:hypothetical protein
MNLKNFNALLEDEEWPAGYIYFMHKIGKQKLEQPTISNKAN